MHVDRPRPLHVVSTVRHPETLVVADHIVRCGPHLRMLLPTRDVQSAWCQGPPVAAASNASSSACWSSSRKCRPAVKS